MIVKDLHTIPTVDAFSIKIGILREINELIKTDTY